NFTKWTLILSELIYVDYNLADYPEALFNLNRQRSIKDTFIGGIIAGVLMTVPWFLTYFALMGNYSSTKVFDADVPWLLMLDGYGLWVTILFGLDVGWTLIVSATGIINAFIDRVNYNLEEVGKKPMSRGQDATVAIVGLVLSALLASVGISDLVDIGDTIIGYAMLIVYGFPMITIGVYKVIKGMGNK